MRLILLPGLDGTGQLFAPLFRVLPPHIQATAVTYPPNERRSYSELCERVRASLPLDEPYVIVAESFSGPIAVRLAAESPRNLQAVVFCASFAFAHVPGSFVARAALTFFSRFLFTLPPPRRAVGYFLAGSDAPEELLSFFYQAIATVPCSVLSYRLRIALAADERQTLRDTFLPFLYLLPTRDRLLGRRSLDLMLHFRRDISIVPIEAPHFVLQRNPTDAVRRIETWLQERGLISRCN
jgi:pimeloyl-[acyl-carrier protein] methyl ester esterase